MGTRLGPNVYTIHRFHCTYGTHQLPSLQFKRDTRAWHTQRPRELHTHVFVIYTQWHTPSINRATRVFATSLHVNFNFNLVMYRPDHITWYLAQSSRVSRWRPQAWVVRVNPDVVKLSDWWEMIVSPFSHVHNINFVMAVGYIKRV